jgi:hypothetical protein
MLCKSGLETFPSRKLYQQWVMQVVLLIGALPAHIPINPSDGWGVGSNEGNIGVFQMVGIKEIFNLP